MSSTNALSDQENHHLERAFALTNATEAADLYDEWAQTYDHDLEGMQYALPATASEALISALRKIDASFDQIEVLDAGCGTGLVGISLVKSGIHQIDGLDISQGMLDVAAKTGTYRKLGTADLSRSIDSSDGAYDAVICVGTLTQGHLGPQPIQDLVRVSKSIIVFTVGGGLWESGGYRKKVDELCDQRKIKILSSDAVGVTEGQTEGAQLVVLVKA